MTISKNPATSREQLRERNLRIGEAERVHDLAFLASALREDLVFRRADGRVVGRSDSSEASAAARTRSCAPRSWRWKSRRRAPWPP